MRRSTLIILLLLVFFIPARLSHSWVQPFKMGQGRFLDQMEIKSLFHEINGQPESFKNSFSETLKSLNASPFEYEKDNKKYQVIEFTKFQIKVSGMEKAKGQGPYYMFCISCNEGIPDAELPKRKKIKNRYYDIWVLSGYYILLEKDTRTKEYRILSSGGAE